MAIKSGTATAGRPAPDFELPDGEGNTVRLSDLWAKGPVVLTFLRGFA